MAPSDPMLQSVRPAEKLLLEPWQSLLRVVYGFCLGLLVEGVFDARLSWWQWLFFLLGALVVLRLASIVLRKVIPFSRAVSARWRDQRDLGKLYDSFYWSKLLWIGVGIFASLAFADKLGREAGAVALFCILAGGLGNIIWLRVQSTRKADIEGRATRGAKQ